MIWLAQSLFSCHAHMHGASLGGDKLQLQTSISSHGHVRQCCVTVMSMLTQLQKLCSRSKAYQHYYRHDGSHDVGRTALGTHAHSMQITESLKH